MSDTIVEEYKVEIETDKITGHKIQEIWHLNNNVHRIGRPAIRQFNDMTGYVYHEEYWVNGRLHRDHGPAVITRDQETGSIIRTYYYKNGARQDLPKGPLIT